MQVAAAPFPVIQGRDGEGLPVAVQAHDGGEHRPFVPPHQQLPEIRVVHVAFHEAADVGIPPGDARHADGKARRHLIPQRFPGGGHVAAPKHVAVLLAARPAGAQQVHGLLVGPAHGLKVGAAVILGIDVAAFQGRAQIIAEVVEIVLGQVRLGIVQPEEINAVIVIMALALVPHVGPGFRVGGVDLHAVALEIIGLRRAALGAHEQAPFHHFIEVFAAPVHAGPHGHHHFDAHAVQFVHHGLGVGPVFPVEFPVALHRPVEEVDHDNVDGDVPPVVFPGHGQNFFLGAVAQLALPQAHAVLPHHGGAARDGGVLVQKLPGLVLGGDPVVHFLAGPGHPFGQVLAEGHFAHGGIVPQKAVAQAGNHEGHRYLGIALGQLQHAALHIQVGLLILAHAEDFFPVGAFKAHGQLVVPGGVGQPFPAGHLQAVAFPGDGAVVKPVIFL